MEVDMGIRFYEVGRMDQTILTENIATYMFNI